MKRRERAGMRSSRREECGEQRKVEERELALHLEEAPFERALAQFVGSLAVGLPILLRRLLHVPRAD